MRAVKLESEMFLVEMAGSLLLVAGLLAVMKGLFEGDIYAAVLGTVMAVVGAIILASVVVSYVFVLVAEKYWGDKHGSIEGKTA